MIRCGALLGPILVQAIHGSGVANRVESETRGSRLLIPDREVDKSNETASIAGPLTASKERKIVEFEWSGMVDMMTTQLTPPIQTVATPQPS